MSGKRIMDGITGAEALLRTLRRMGVEKIFASPGSDWAPLWEALARLSGREDVPEYVSSRHEETAIAMASGYGKATGKLSAVVLHTTVGALHATMAMRAALHERIPMVVLAGESVSFGERPGYGIGPQWLRLLSDVGGPARLVAPCVKWSFGLNDSVLLPATIARACQIAAAAPRGPAFVSVPTEFLMDGHAAEAQRAQAPVRDAAVDPAALEELAEMLCAAKSPIILTEEVGKDAGAVGRLVSLAETLGAPVFDGWQPGYANFPRAHPLYGGVAPEMKSLLEEADVLFCVETVVPAHPPAMLSGSKTRIAVLGEDPLHVHLPYWGFRTDLVVAGAVEPSLAFLCERVARALPQRTRAPAAARWAKRNGELREKLRGQGRAAGAQSAIESAWIGHELNAVLPEGAIVVDETITHRHDVLRQLDRLGPGGFISASYGGLGMGIGTALGAKLALPERTVVVTIGDGAFYYNPVLASFGASQELRLPLLVVLFNNAGYLSQKLDVVREYPDGAAVRSKHFAGLSILPRPDYPALARAFGGHGESVERPAGVRPALLRGLEAVSKGKLALIEMVLEPVGG
ncbi:MAG TPA: thiamine pyrophosphate-binding protein [Burkholderiales bacterium]|nr:thiamine pyrophosphate-binding protein [Burkholderiales bacterium]